jgi:hypothetical protein
MDDAFYKLIKTVFRTQVPKPTTPNELVQFYGTLVKSTTNRNFVNVTNGKVTINDETAQHHLNLNMFKNIDRTGFSPEAQQHFNIEPKHEATCMMNGTSLGLDD